MNQVFAAAQEVSSEGSSFPTLIWYIIGAVGLWKMFEKAGVEGWASLIPFYRDYKLCEKVMNDPWYWVREFWVIVPFVGWVLALYYKYRIGRATARAFGKPEGWAWGYLFLEPIFFCLTGFDNSSYYGAFGAGDTRTDDAREAKTVDFNVVKNELPKGNGGPVEDMSAKNVTAQPRTVEVKAEPVSEDVVDFEFNQDEISE
jgi:hypothetical protein